MQAATLTRARAAVLRDVVALTKPRVTLMVLFTAAGGMWLAPDSLPTPVIAIMLLTTMAVVSAANSLNCWLERDTDRLMQRTMKRPLPARRLRPRVALVLGAVLGCTSVPILAWMVNPLTGLLGAIALVSYVAIYTPMKRASSLALLVGAVPGALPPLMGWTAATGELDAPGLALFAILFFWQVPHFLAISIYRQHDYDRAGLKTLPSERGIGVAKPQAVLYTGMLLVCSILPYAYQVAGPLYLAVALIVGVYFMAVALSGFRADDDQRWGRRLFLASLVYVTVLFAAILGDGLLA